MEQPLNTNSTTNFAPIIIPGFVLGVLTFFIWKYLNSKNKKTNEAKCAVVDVPERWVKIGKLDKLLVFPIKSCPGVEVKSAVITKLGLKFADSKIRDRDFMIVDTKGKQVTLVNFPQMALIEITLERGDKLTLTAPGMDSVTFGIPKYSPNAEKLCRVKHDAHIKALDCGDEIADWIQRYLRKDGYRMYYHHLNETQRTFEPYMYDCPDFKIDHMGAFHNETAYLLCAQESIDELNKFLNKESSWKNWRPTILIDEIQEPFAEVNWRFVRIGSNNGILKSCVPCYRCPLTTVDPDEGTMPKDGEPLKTLRNLKKSELVVDQDLRKILDNKGIMGLRLGLYSDKCDGTLVHTGDPVYTALL